MMPLHDELSLLMLAELPTVGQRGAHATLAFARTHGMTLAAALELPAHRLVTDCGFAAAAVACLTNRRPWHVERCRNLLDAMGSCGASIHAFDSPQYPARWQTQARPAPPFAVCYGNRRVLDGLTVAVLNSRSITAPSVSATIRLVHRLAEEGCALITGGMKSTYRIAAVAARAAGTPRIIVLDRGLFAAFPHGLDRDPSGFGPHYSGLDAQQTLLLSPFRLHDHAAPGNGRRRDHLIAALADLVIAVNARPGGEIERVCLRALDAGQSVLSWMGENRGLMAAGARAIDDTDVIHGLRRFVARPAPEAARAK